nr:MAG TPA: hypothetical protein [Inoviridae sp.]
MTSVIRCRERWWRSEEKEAVLIEALRRPCLGSLFVLFFYDPFCVSFFCVF